jgi:hypothetical protein
LKPQENNIKAINFKTKNGENLVRLLSTGQPIPVHVPTSRKVRVGELLKLTYGDRVKPTTLAVVRVEHEHEWETSDRMGQNLIVRKVVDSKGNSRNL